MCWHTDLPFESSCVQTSGGSHTEPWSGDVGVLSAVPAPPSQFAVEVAFPLPGIDLPGGFRFDHNTAQGPWVPLCCKLVVETLGGTE